MKAHAASQRPTPAFISKPVRRHQSAHDISPRHRFNLIHSKWSSHVTTLSLNKNVPPQSTEFSRRHVFLSPLIAVGASILLQSATASADETQPSPPAQPTTSTMPQIPETVKAEEVVVSRIYDATVIGEPLAVGKDKRKVWEKLMNARVVYLGEAEQVPVRDDRELELQIVKNLRKRCVESERTITLALEAFPSDLQDQLNQYTDKRYYILSTPKRNFNFVALKVKAVA